MKKYIVASGVCMLVYALVANAEGYTFSTDLTIGSTGPDVVLLQTWLNAHGFTIPALNKGTSPGRFGTQTKAAVRAYQQSVNLPSTGYVGPLTRGKLNAGATVVLASPVIAAACPAGYHCDPIATLANSLTEGKIMTPGIAGTLAFALQSTPSNGTSVDKGGSADIARYKLQAGASDMAVSSLAVDFDSRFWLYASTITIKDDAGNVLATKSGLTQNDFTEITVGSDYRVYIPVSYVVSKAAIKYLTVSVSLLPVTDRSAATLSITQAQIRSVDGTGVTDTETESADRSFSYTGSNNGLIVITNNENSPPNMLVQVSTAAETNDVVMGVADFTSQGVDSTLKSMTLYLLTSSSSDNTVTFRDVKVKSGDLVYSADSIGVTVSFSNMAIPLPRDTKVPIAILVSLNRDAAGLYDGISASTTLDASGTAGGTSNNPVVENSSFNTIDINDAPLATSDITFSSSNASIDYTTTVATLGHPVMNSNSTSAYPVTMAFTLEAGDNTLYIAANPAVALATTSTGYATAANTNSTLTQVTTSPGTLAGDAATSTSNATAYYVIPAGSSRTFKYDGAITSGNTTGMKTLKITGVKYGTNANQLTANTVVFFNYDALKVTPVF